jgi:phenylpropionate dioxygenase-like ring-hydroxylating dioxygenase large terminal subunit
MPNEPLDSNFKSKIRQQAYPTREQGGVVWIYMGPPQKQPPELPQLEWVRAPEGHQHVSKWLQRTNWAQGMEGEIDTTHLSFLHSTQRPYLDALSRTRAVGNAALRKAQADGMPRLTLRETPYGFTYGARRNTSDGEYYWRVTRWLYPFFSLIAGNLGTGGRAWVPIDDEHTWTFSYQCHPDEPYTEEERAEFKQGWGLPPRLTRGTYTLKDGYKIDTWLPAANMENDYLIDREMQKETNYSGIWGINEQDRSLQENMGQIVDRSREHLGTSDIAAIAARRLLINMARDLENGIEPEIARNADAYRLRAIDVVSPIGDFDDLLEAHHMVLGVAKV